MLYKTSRFTFYHISIHDGSLLLYNSFVGEKSLSCIQDRQLIEKALRLLKMDKIEADGSLFIEALAEKGFIVPFAEDELLKLKIKILRDATNPVLKLTILPTEKCNFRCKYCYETHIKGAMPEEIQNAIVRYVRRNIFQFSTLQVNWFGGEPLEAIDVISSLSAKLMSITNAAKRRYISFMTTNGYDLDAEMLRKLLKFNIYTYQITLDGMKHSHDALRVLENGEGTYDTILRNLLDIKRNVTNKHFAILIRTNFSKESFRDLDTYIKEYSAIFADDTRFQFSPRFMGAWNERFDDHYMSDVLNDLEIKRFHNELNKKNKSLNIASYNFLTQDSLCEASSLHSYVIGSDGQIYKCTADFEFAENKIGYIDAHGEFIIDESMHSKWIDLDLPASCRTCFFAGACQARSCPKAFLKKIPACSYEKSNIRDVLDTLDRKHFYAIS